MTKKSKLSAREEHLAEILDEAGLMVPLVSVMVEQLESGEAYGDEISSSQEFADKSEPMSNDEFRKTHAFRELKEHFPQFSDDETCALSQEF